MWRKHPVNVMLIGQCFPYGCIGAMCESVCVCVNKWLLVLLALSFACFYCVKHVLHRICVKRVLSSWHSIRKAVVPNHQVADLYWWAHALCWGLALQSTHHAREGATSGVSTGTTDTSQTLTLTLTQGSRAANPCKPNYSTVDLYVILLSNHTF